MDNVQDIDFECLGYSVSDVYLATKDGHWKIGLLIENKPNCFEYCEDSFVTEFGFFLPYELPTELQVIAEYKQKLADKGKSINDKIVLVKPK